MAMKSEKCVGLLKEIFYQNVKDNTTIYKSEQKLALFCSLCLTCKYPITLPLVYYCIEQRPRQLQVVW